MHLPAPGDYARKHYKTGRGYRMALHIGNVAITLQAPSEDTLRAIGLNSLDELAEHFWTTKSEVVPAAQALGVAVTTSDTVAEIKAAISLAAQEA